MTKNWHFLQDKGLEFGDRSSYWNTLGQGKYRTFTFQDHECVAFRQFWGQHEATRGVDAGTRMLTGYYCGPSGVSLSERTIESILDSIYVRSDGELTVVTKTSKATESFDGKWVLEIAEASNKSRKDRRVILIKDSKFSVEVSFDGWRGTIVGEINNSGQLAGKTNLRKMQFGRRMDPFDARYLEGEFHARSVSKSRSGGVYRGAVFLIDLTRTTALSKAECIAIECEDKDEQATNSLPDSQTTQETPSQTDSIAANATLEGGAGFDGTWIFEITDTDNLSATDRRIVEIKNNRFTTKVSTNGWRGELHGEIDQYGRLVGQGTVSRMGLVSSNITIYFTSYYRSGGFQEEVSARARYPLFFRVNLTREQLWLLGEGLSKCE
jgi:hypothetical protein